MDYTRTGKTWTINECLQLQREHELLGWTIDEIAIKHKRTPNAIMYKIVKEEFENFDLLSSYLFCKNDMEDDIEKVDKEQEKSNDTDSDKSSNKEDDLNELKNHVKSLENKMLTIIELLVSQTKNKNAALYENFF